MGMASKSGFEIKTDWNRLVNGSNVITETDNITDGVEQLLDLVHILILALNHAAWPVIVASQGALNASASVALKDIRSDLASQALISLIDTTELFPPVIKIDLYGGIYSVYDSKSPVLLNLI